ncbi:MAG: cytochrome c4 [Rhizobiales bacterium]|nr:cytochrome c4 [Hyphomicrobiales bacterium]
MLMILRTLIAVALTAWLLSGPMAKAQETLAEKIELCTSCHGEKGLPEQAEVPIIWGQEYYYLYVQLKDYKAGRRANETMQGIAEELSKDDMKALAQHFAEKKWPATGFRSSDAADKAGLNATAAGQCVQCHLGGYEGNSRIPRLSGQTLPYLARTMQEFKDKIRLNSPAKGSLMSSYSQSDIDNMASYLAGL